MNTGTQIFFSGNFFRDVITILAPQYLCHLFIGNSAGEAYPLHNTFTDLKMPKISFFREWTKMFSYRRVNLWNNLPTESKRAPTLSNFNILTS